MDLDGEDPSCAALGAEPAILQQQQSVVTCKGEKQRPELPRLGLRTREDSFMEREAFQKISALPRDFSSSSEWSATPMSSAPISARSAKLGMHSRSVVPSMPRVSEAEFVVDTKWLELAFDANGKEVTYHFSRRPLGAEFRQRGTGATKVSKVFPESHAAAVGLEVGWILKRIAGVDVTRTSFTEIQEVLRAAIDMLPCADSEFAC